MSATNLVQLLDRRAERDRDREAVVCDGHRLSWSDLYAEARSCVSRLEGISTPLAVLAHPRPETIAWIWAALLSRTTFAPIDPGLPLAARESVLQRLGATTLADCDRLRTLTGIEAVSQDSSIASVLFTSGSTGRPKGVAMSPEAMAHSVESIGAYLGLRAEDRIWGGLALHYGYGLYQIFLSAAAGATLVIPRSAALVGETLRVLETEKITVVPGVPSLWTQLLRTNAFRRERFPALRILTNAGEALPVHHSRELRARFANLDIHAMYGLTEYTRVASLDPSQLDQAPTSVGRPIRGCQARVVDEQGRELGPGRVGELVVRGPHMMTGYWRDPEATSRCRRSLDDGGEPWLFTGDLFEFDTAGRLHHRGRRDDVFKCRGQKVSPARVRQLLESLPGVEEALVMGVGDPGETEVLAIVQSRAPLDLAALRQLCRQHLAPHEIPSRIENTDMFPRNARGKIDRNAVLALATAPGDDPC